MKIDVSKKTVAFLLFPSTCHASVIDTTLLDLSLLSVTLFLVFILNSVRREHNLSRRIVYGSVLFISIGFYSYWAWIIGSSLLLPAIIVSELLVILFIYLIYPFFLHQKNFPMLKRWLIFEHVILVCCALFYIWITHLNVPSHPHKSRSARAKTDISAIEGALQVYRLENKRFPTTQQGLQALITIPTDGPIPKNWQAGGYLDRMPMDPWGREYIYRSPGVSGPFDLYTFGRDSLPGGVDADADIGNWMSQK